MAEAALLVLGLFGALAAAKLHGRALRLEREQQGIRSVVFGGQNPPFVEALWRAERWRFWGLASALAGASVAARALGWSWPGRGVALALLLHAVAPLSVAFAVTGLLSGLRLATAARHPHPAPPPEWAAQARAGTLRWWGLWLALAVAQAAGLRAL